MLKKWSDPWDHLLVVSLAIRSHILELSWHWMMVRRGWFTKASLSKWLLYIGAYFHLLFPWIMQAKTTPKVVQDVKLLSLMMSTCHQLGTPSGLSLAQQAIVWEVMYRKLAASTTCFMIIVGMLRNGWWTTAVLLHQLVEGGGGGRGAGETFN